VRSFDSNIGAQFDDGNMTAGLIFDKLSLPAASCKGWATLIFGATPIFVRRSVNTSTTNLS